VESFDIAELVAQPDNHEPAADDLVEPTESIIRDDLDDADELIGARCVASACAAHRAHTCRRTAGTSGWCGSCSVTPRPHVADPSGGHGEDPG